MSNKENSSILVSGRVVNVLPYEQKTEKFGCQKIHVETLEQYSQTLELQINNKQFNAIIGDTGVFHINLKGRKYNEKVFNSLECWKWEIDQL